MNEYSIFVLQPFRSRKIFIIYQIRYQKNSFSVSVRLTAEPQISIGKKLNLRETGVTAILIFKGLKLRNGKSG